MMKRIKFLPWITASILFSCMLCISTYAAIPEPAIYVDGETLIYDYATTVSEQNISRYILLFTKQNQVLMSDFINANGYDDFFLENQIDITNVSKLSFETGTKSAGISTEELSAYDDMEIYYVELLIDNTQLESKLFVLVKETGAWKISRISTPDFKLIVESGEGFNDSSEQLQLQNQENEKDMILSANVAGNATQSN